jgi:hypothetical protein
LGAYVEDGGFEKQIGREFSIQLNYHKWGNAFGAQSERRSHGFSLEAYLALIDIPGDVSQALRQQAKAWWEADDNTGGRGQLWDTANGGIVDWYSPDGSVAPSWQKFIDTSSNSIFVYRGGFNHLLTDTASSPQLPLAQPGTSNDPSGLVVYPNPYQPGSTGPYGDTTAGRGVVFDHLARGAEIRIFSLAGDQVADARVADESGRYVWDARNTGGQEVASGVYVYLVTANGGKKSGKLAILR